MKQKYLVNEDGLCKCGCGGKVKCKYSKFLPNHYWKSPESKKHKELVSKRNKLRSKDIPNIAPCVSRRFKGGKYYSRYIMEQRLGRALESHEHVHHINGDKTDDSFDNLVILTIREHYAVHHTPKDCIKYICPTCGLEFMRARWYNKDSKKKYCSKQCFYASSLKRKVSPKEYNHIIYLRHKSKISARGSRG